MYGGDPWPVIIGAGALTVSAAVVFGLAMWWMLPPAGRAFTPPPVDAPGTTYHCYCYDRPVRVAVIDPAHCTVVMRRVRHRRPPRVVRWWRRIRPAPPGDEGAVGAGSGSPPAPVAA
ncbi:hypothetical protein ACFY2W_23220 [Streptomyces sp. NPDC001262]|uniref:hypothetical protein n=1 Tax=Streptomyces sp. NPDC001262 TaxID=3364552 RepID=UPI0036AEABA1